MTEHPRLWLLRRRFNRYDLDLAVIPMSFVSMALASSFFGISLETAMVIASVIGLLAMLDGMVLRPPNATNGT